MVRSSSGINQALAATSTRIGAFGKAFAGGLVGGVVTGALATFSSNIRATIKGIAQLGSEAKRSGLSLQAFQEWKFVGDQNRIQIDSIIDGFKELSLRADEWISTGAGPGAEVFKRLGFSATELQGKLKDPSNLMLEIIGRLQSLDKAAQIRIADEVFGGTGGERFVELLAQGESGIRRTITQAHELGAVLDAEMIGKADALDRKFEQIATKLQSLGKQIAVGLAENVGLIDDIDRVMGGKKAAEGLLGGGLREVLSENGVALEHAAGDVKEVQYLYEDLQRDVLAATRMIGGEVPAILESGADGAEELAIELATATDEMEALIGQVIRGEKPATVLETEMAALIERARVALEEANKIDGINLDLAIGQVDRLSGALGRAMSWAAGVVDKMREAAGLAPAAGLTDDFGAAISEARDGRPTVSVQPAISGTPRPKTAPSGIGGVDWGTAPAARGAGGGGGGRSAAGFASAAEAIREETAALVAEAAAFASVAASGRQYGDAVEFAQRRAKLLHAAQMEGKALTPELRTEIDQLAEAYARAARRRG